MSGLRRTRGSKRVRTVDGDAGRRGLGRFLPALLAVALGACGAAEDPQVRALPTGTEPGERAPELAGRRADGSGYRVAPPDGTGTVIVFYRGYHCGLCRERLQELQRNLELYRRAGVRVVAVTPDPPSAVREAEEALSLSFPVVSVDSAVLAEWDVLAAAPGLPLPASYLLDGRGVVLFRHIGRNAADRASDLEILAALR